MSRFPSFLHGLCACCLLACQGVSRDDGLVAPGAPGQHIATAPSTTAPLLFESAFKDSTEVQQDSVVMRLQPVFLGNLPITSGRIVAYDGVSGGQAFAQQFPRGSFPVELALARFADGDERVAFARIRFSSRPVHHWQMAVWPGQQLLPVEGEDYYGYNVDAGMGLFMDEQAMRALKERLHQSPDGWEQIFTAGFAFDSPTPRQGFLYRVDGQTLAAFMSGFGDGSYASYIGFDAAGLPCRLLTDFQVVNWQKN